MTAIYHAFRARAYRISAFVAVIALHQSPISCGRDRDQDWLSPDRINSGRDRTAKHPHQLWDLIGLGNWQSVSPSCRVSTSRRAILLTLSRRYRKLPIFAEFSRDRRSSRSGGESPINGLIVIPLKMPRTSDHERGIEPAKNAPVQFLASSETTRIGGELHCQRPALVIVPHGGDHRHDT